MARRSRGKAREGAVGDTAWRDQADWYDQRHGDAGDHLHATVVLPAVLRQLRAKPGDLVLDLCCGQGVLSRLLQDQGFASVGLDASEELIAKARQRQIADEEYLVGDARDCGRLLAGRPIAHAACVLALQDLDPITALFDGVAGLLGAGGRFVIVLTHPCFRQAQHSAWTWDAAGERLGRRSDAYLQNYSVEIVTNPGRSSSARSTSFHRPLQDYLQALGEAGFGVIGAEELTTPRRGSAGPQAAEEDRAAREFPVFLLLTALRLD